MPRRGAKPQPTILRRLNGNPRGVNEKEAMPSRDISMEIPEWAQMTTEAKTVWFRLAPMVHRNGLLTEADLEQFVRYCDMLPRWYAMKKHIEENGYTYEVVSPIFSGFGKDRNIIDYKVTSINQYPQVKLYLEFDKALKHFEAEFGLSPSARTRIHAVDDSHDSEELDFYFGGARRSSYEQSSRY